MQSGLELSSDGCFCKRLCNTYDALWEWHVSYGLILRKMRWRKVDLEQVSKWDIFSIVTTSLFGEDKNIHIQIFNLVYTLYDII